MAELTAGINVIVNTSQAVTRLRELQAQVNTLNRSANVGAAASKQALLNKYLRDAATESRLFTSAITPMSHSVDTFSKHLDKGNLSLTQYTRGVMSQMPGMRRTFIREFDMITRVAENRVKRLQTQYTIMQNGQALALTPTGLAPGGATGLAVAAQRQAIFNKMISDGSTKLLNWGKNTQWAGRQLMVGFTLPLTIFGGVAAKVFMDLDKQARDFKRVYGDAFTPPEEIQQNLEAIKELGAEYTKYGIKLQDTMQVASTAAAAGMRGEKLMSGTEESLRLATIGQIDYNQALTTTITLQNAFKVSNQDMAETVDFIGAVANQTVLTVDDMTKAIPRVAPVIVGLGGDIKDLAALMTALKEGGVSAENGANALKSGLASLINPTDRASKALAKMGVDIKGIVQANKGDLMGTIQTFADALGKLGSFERQQALEKVFGKYQYAKLSALFDNISKKGTQASVALDLAGASAEELGKLSAKSLSEIEESTTAKFQKAMERLKISIAPIGEAFLKALTPFLEFLTKIAEGFNNLPKGVKDAIVKVTAALGIVTPVVLMLAGLFGNFLAQMIKGFNSLRKFFAMLKGDASAFRWLAGEELDAAAAARSLESASIKLTDALLLQERAVLTLTELYERLVMSANGAATAMGTAASAAARPMSAAVAGATSAGVAGAAKAARPLRANKGMTMVPGTGNSDTIPALLTPGESVITKEATQKYGPILQQMNDGTLPGFIGGGFSIGRTLSSLMTTRSGIPSVKGGRESLLQMITDISLSRGIRPRGGRSLDPTKAPTINKDGQTYAAVPIVRGHHVPGISRKNGDQYLPGLMFWQGKDINHKLVHGGVTGEQLLADYRLMEKSGVYPPSLMIAAAKEMGLKDASIDSAYAELKRQLRQKRDYVFKNDDFLDFSGRILHEKMDKDVFSKLFSIGTQRSQGKSTAITTWEKFKENSFSTGVVSLAQTLRSWQASARHVREEPQMLAALMGGMAPLGRKQTLTRGTTLGLGRGSEFAAADEKMIFDMIRAGNIKDLVGKEVSMSGPISYTAGERGIAHRAIEQNPDVNRFEFLRKQHAKAKERHLDNLKQIETLKTRIANNEGPVSLWERQLKERLSYVDMYPRGQKAMEEEMKALAPRGYQHLEMRQTFRPEDYGLSITGGSFMGKPLSEVETIAAGARAKIKNAYINDKGLPIIELENIGDVVLPSAVVRASRGFMPPKVPRSKQVQEILAGTDTVYRSMELKDLKEQSLRSFFKLRFNDVRGKGGSSPRDFLSYMFERWDRVPGRPSLREDTRLAAKTGKLKYPETPQDEYLADMIMTSEKFKDYAVDVFKPIKLGTVMEQGGKYAQRILDGHTRIHALTVKGLIKNLLGLDPAAMSKTELIDAIRKIKQMTEAGKITNKEILAATTGQKLLSVSANKMEVESLFDHPLRRKQMNSMYNMHGRTLIPGIHDRELDKIVEAGRGANFYGIGKDKDSILEAMGFIKVPQTGNYRYDPGLRFRDRSSYVNNTSRRILRDLVEQKEILPLRRNKGGIIPQSFIGNDRMVGRFANGLVPGVGQTDKIPALLTPGESVITKEATAKFGPILQQMNDGTLLGFANGGEDISQTGRTGGSGSKKTFKDFLNQYRRSGNVAQERRLMMQLAEAQVANEVATAQGYRQSQVDKGHIRQAGAGAKAWSRRFWSPSSGFENIFSAGLADPKKLGLKETPGQSEAAQKKRDALQKALLKATEGNAKEQKKVSRLMSKIERGGRLTYRETQLMSRGLLEITKNPTQYLGEAGLSRSSEKKFLKAADTMVKVAAARAEFKARPEMAGPAFTRWQQSVGMAPVPLLPSTTPTPELAAKAEDVKLTRRVEAIKAKARIEAERRAYRGPSAFTSKEDRQAFVEKETKKILATEGKALSVQIAKERQAAQIKAEKEERDRAKKEWKKQDSERRKLARDTAQAEERARNMTETQKAQARALEMRKENPNLSAKEALARARAEIGILPEEKAPKPTAFDKFRSGYGKLSATAMTMGFMGSMLPMMAGDKETGKFLGMDTGAATMGIMAASIAPMLGGGIGKGMVGLTKLLGGGRAVAEGATGFAALGVSGGALAATAGVTAGLVALGVTAWALKKGMDNTLEAGLKYADALTVSTKEQENVAAVFGRTTLEQRRLAKQRQKSFGLTTKEQQAGAEFIKTEPGKAMAENAKFLMTKNVDAVAPSIAAQLSRMIISGAVNRKQAKAIATGLADELGKPEMAIPIITKVNNIVGPEGSTLTKTAIQIVDNLKEEFAKQESSLATAAQTAATAYAGDWAAGIAGGLFGLSGQYDALIEAQVAYTNTVIENGKQIVGAINDEIDRQQILIDKLNEKKKAAKGEDKKADVQKDIDAAEARKKELETRLKAEKLDATNRGVTTIMGSADTMGRAERLTAGYKQIEEASGIADIGEKIDGILNQAQKTMGDITQERTVVNRATGQTSIVKDNLFSDTERDKLRARLIVDMQMGNIDPNAIAALDAIATTDAGKDIMTLAINLQADGNFEAVNALGQLPGMKEDVRNAFVEIGKQSEITNDQMGILANTLTMIGGDDDRLKFLNDLKGLRLPGKEIESFAKSMQILSDAKFDVASIFAMGGTKAVNDTAEALDAVNKKLNKYSKEIAAIGKEKTPEAKMKKTIQVLTNVTDAQGNKITSKQVEQALKNTGLSKKQIFNLPPDIATKSLMLEIDAKSYMQQAIQFRIAANQAIDQKSKGYFTAKADEAYAVAKAFKETGKALVANTPTTTTGNDTGNTTDGGGGKTNPLTELNKSLLEQLQMYSDMELTLKDINKKKMSIADIVLKGQGIFNKLEGIKGMSSTAMEKILGMGAEGAKKWIAKYTKGGKFTEAGRQQYNKIVGGSIAEAQAQQRIANIRTGEELAGANTLRNRGLSQELIDFTSQNGSLGRIGILQQQVAETKKGSQARKDAVKALNQEINLQKISLQLEKDKTSTMEGAQQQMLNALNDRRSAIEADIAAETARLTDESNKAYVAQYGESKTQTEIRIQDNEKIIRGFQDQVDAKQRLNDLDQHAIDLLEHKKQGEQNQINLLQDQIDGKQKIIDKYQHENELRNQQADVINHSLDIMSQKEEQIRDAYDQRIKALDTIASINDHILNQQKSQLNIAQALSQGDIYAAAQAAQDMQASQIQFATDQQRGALQQGMENQIAGLTTENGLTRVQAEQQLAAIKEQNYQNDLLITGLNNQIYNIQQAMLPYKDQIAKYDNDIATYTESIWNRNQEIYKIQNDSITPLTNINTALSRQLSDSQDLLDKNTKLYALKYEGELSSIDMTITGTEAVMAQEKALQGVATQWQNIAKQVDQVNKLMRDASKTYSDIALNPLSTPDQIAQAKKNYEDAKNKYEQKMNELKNQVSNMKTTGINNTIGNFYGGIKTSARGGIVGGTGGRDSIPYMLTPGEFVMRKAAVNKYGPTMFEKMNMGSFAMPKYDMNSEKQFVISSPNNSTNISAPVYNTYSINVPVHQPNATADEIANKVMNKMRAIENITVRGYRG